MKKNIQTIEEYLEQLEQDVKEQFIQLRTTVLKNLPDGFAEMFSYGMISYVVPFELYPEGYHANPDLPLPFLFIAVQKNHFAVYHMGLYSNPLLMQWFTEQFVLQYGKKPDIGKSCIRLKKTEELPLTLIGELIQKITPQQWIQLYKSTFTNEKKKKY